MARYISLALVIALFFVSHGQAADDLAAPKLEDVLGAEDAKNVEERSLYREGRYKTRTQARPTPASYRAPTQPQPTETNSLGSLSVTPSIALLHSCWAAYSNQHTITAAILSGIQITGLTISDIKGAKVLVSAVTVQKKATSSYNAAPYGGESYGKQQDVHIAVAQTNTWIQKSSSLENLAKNLAEYVVLPEKKVNGVVDVLCLDIVLELKIIESKPYVAPVRGKPQRVYPEPSYPDTYDEPEY